jgi:Ca-activated chloride channel homolog
MSSRRASLAPVCAAVVLTAVWLGTPLVARPQVFTSRIDSVRLDVLVTSNNQPVMGLTASDFEVRDNGVPQQVDHVSFEKVPLNVVLALDMSSSLGADAVEHLRDASRALLDGLRPNDSSGLITFSHEVLRRVAPSKDAKRVRAVISTAEPSGETALIDASQAAFAFASSPTERGLVVIFSDGLDTNSWLTADLMLATVRRSEVVAYAVRVGSLDDGFLGDLTDATGGRLLQLQSTDALRATFVKILEEFRHRYLVSFTPRGVASDGWHRLQVRVKQRGAVVRTRAGYSRS